MPRTNSAVARLEGSVVSALDQAGFSSGKKLIVAVSGGPDSLALLHALHLLSAKFDLVLHAAHLDHGLRGEASASDARFVAETCERLGVALTSRRDDVRAHQKTRRLSLEQAGREVRYAFLSGVARDQGADAVALGHTADDQAETVLMHIIRGTGLTGLRGMQTVSRRVFEDSQIDLFRPLLDMSGEDTRAYCTELDLHPREDETNQSTGFSRNLIRLDLIPRLEEYNPSVKDALIRLSRSAGQDVQYVESNVDDAWNEAATVVDGNAAIDRGMFLLLEPAIQAHLLRRALATVKGGPEDIQQRHVDGMRKLMDGPAGRTLDLPGGVRFSVSYDQANLTRNDSDLPQPLSLNGEYELLVPGEIPVGAWLVKAKILDRPPTLAQVTRPELDLEMSPLGPDGGTALLSLAGIGDRLIVRSRRPGDRFQPLGMSQPKKLQDFMVDAKIPARLRDLAPLVTAEKGIAWVAGWRIADWAKVRDEDERCLEVRFVQRKRTPS